MSIVKHGPKQPILETDGRWDWENEETLVDKRNKLPNRIKRIIRQWWLWTALIALFVYALFNPDVMRAIVAIGGVVVIVIVTISMALIQFVAIFWFLSRSRMYTIMPGAEGVGFKDYRGQPELLEQANQIVTLLRGVKAFEGAGGEPLNGLLLEGPPGTGKTWLAQAISTEAGVPFYYVDTSSLQGMFMGTGTLKVVRMYGKARKAAKEYGAAVVFLDEIDAIGSRSGVSQVGGGGGMGGFGGGGGMGGMGLLSTMLIEMSGFSMEHGWRARLRTFWYKTLLRRKVPKPQKRVLTIGATNRIAALDPALLRPGRFDKKVRIDVPDMEGRRDIFGYYLSKMAHDDTMDPVILAAETPGYSPADIKYLLNESLRYALFSGRRYISYSDFQRAQPEHEMGLRAPAKHMSREARERLAYYRAGYAVAVRLFLPTHRIARLSILRQGMNFGHVAHYPASEAYQGMSTKAQYFDRLRVLISGRASEIEFCGFPNQTVSVISGRGTSGSMFSDFEGIRKLVRRMALAGMLGPLGAAVSIKVDPRAMSMAATTPEMEKAMDEAVQKVLIEARQALREHEEVVKGLVKLLMEKEELLADELRAYFDQFGLFTPDPSIIKDGEEIIITKPPVVGRVAALTEGDSVPAPAGD